VTQPRQPGVRGRPPSSRRDPQGGSNVVQISMATTNYLRWPGASRPPYPIHAPDHIRPALRVASTHDGAGRTPGFTRGYPCSTRVPRVAGRIPVGRRNPAVAGERHSPLDSPPRERSFNNDVRRPHDGNEPRAAIASARARRDAESDSPTRRAGRMSVAPGASPGFGVARHRQGATRKAGRMWSRSRWPQRTTSGGPGLRDHLTPSTHPIIFDPLCGSPRLTMGRDGPRVSPGATHVRPACRGSPEGFRWGVEIQL